MKRDITRRLLLGACLFASSVRATAQYLLTVPGDATQARLGNAVEGGMDVDFDGHPDLLLAAHRDSTGAPQRGSVRVVSGWSALELYRVVGAGQDGLGESVAFVGDVDLDGAADFVAGAPQSTLGGGPPGYARLYSGATGAVLWTRTGPSSYSYFGCSVTGVGDVDGDGRPDVAVGARHASPNGTNSGAVYVYSGASGALIVSWGGVSAGDELGWSIAGIGDANGDGTPDLAASAVGWDEAGSIDVGAVAVHALPSGVLIRRQVGTVAHGSLGWCVGSGGDVDGDGIRDFVVGTPVVDFGGVAQSGAAFVYSTASGALLWSFGGVATFASAGQSCTIVGDVDADGRADVAVGSPGQPSPTSCGGRVDVYSGASGLVLRSSCGAAFEDSMGCAVARAGDTNGDGFADVVIGARMSDSGGTNSGAAYLLSGFDCMPPVNYCVALPNSVGSGAVIGWSGSTSLAWNHLTLSCSGVAPNATGLFFLGTTQIQQPFGDGYRCAGGAVLRLPIVTANVSGSVQQHFDLPHMPNGVVLHAGDVRNVQFWYRDALLGGAGFNLSNALSLRFCP